MDKKERGVPMEYIKIVIASLASIITLFFITKVIGDRQISQLSMFDYINGITIGSIAAEMATSLEKNPWYPFIAMVVYGVASVFMSYTSCKSIKFRRFVEGKAIILFHDKSLYQKNLLKAKIDVDEFLTLCRQSGYFTLEDIHTAILEPNGKISFLPNSYSRPVNPRDLNLDPVQALPAFNVIIDGKILYGNLKATGNNEKWLEKQLREYGIKDMSVVMLATCDKNNNFYVYEKQTDSETRDIFE